MANMSVWEFRDWPSTAVPGIKQFNRVLQEALVKGLKLHTTRYYSPRTTLSEM